MGGEVGARCVMGGIIDAMEVEEGRERGGGERQKRGTCLSEKRQRLWIISRAASPWHWGQDAGSSMRPRSITIYNVGYVSVGVGVRMGVGVGVGVGMGVSVW